MSEFSSHLAALENEGGAILVTGADVDDAHTMACADMLAATSAAPRRRVIVALNGWRSLAPRFPTERGTVPDTTVITAPAGRSATAAQSTSVPQGVDVVDVDDASLGAIAEAVSEAIERIRRRHGPLEPTELRVGIDSLSSLLDVYGEPQVFAFLVVFTRYLRSCDALGHCHLPMDRTTYVARLLAPLFDAVVELRARHDQPQQRWYLDDGATTSPWVSL